VRVAFKVSWHVRVISQLCILNIFYIVMIYFILAAVYSVVPK